MKNKLNYKNMLSRFVLIFFCSHSFAQAEEISMTITSTLRDRPAGTTSNHYLCLGDLSQNVVVATKVTDLNTVFPGLFQDLSSSEKNCFATDQVPAPAQKTVNQILSLMNQKVENSLASNSNKTDTQDKKAVQIILPITQEKTIFKLRNQDRPLGRKLMRAELLVGGMQAAGMAFLIVSPQFSLWGPDWQKSIGSNLRRAWTTPPVWDQDSWPINYVSHPHSGSMYYNAIRSQGATPLQSFIYASIQSTFWEYVVEAISEQPSINDLIVTPIGGAILGEFAHRATLGMRKNGFNTIEKIVVTIINPTYVLNNGYK